ncbi:Exonuclease RNase T and DNA polymerase III [Hyphomicrobium denitrificans ATCC 51888]|uniref:Exonuclease RNase T and DNA polymerase III n=2 Tax=Hyphomicrobium denitrificans TaxID=53399 RepID=D8JVG8_HYPDA|nr:Exonuclease RNase T and DNA polymerase III [Hyphomicrobium denitrificans ATCC 51888]
MLSAGITVHSQAWGTSYMGSLQRILFVDTETTGLRRPSAASEDHDRVISIGFFDTDASALQAGFCRGKFGYFIFNPQQASAAGARRVHGYSDRILAQQDTFASCADMLFPAFGSADLIVSHNTDFDRPFVESEFAGAGRSLRGKSWHCTMQAERARGGGSASLDASIDRLGIQRQSGRHGALEDAWLAMMLYLAQNGIRLPDQQYRPHCDPMNYRELVRKKVAVS